MQKEAIKYDSPSYKLNMSLAVSIAQHLTQNIHFSITYPRMLNRISLLIFYIRNFPYRIQVIRKTAGMRHKSLKI